MEKKIDHFDIEVNYLNAIDNDNHGNHDYMAMMIRTLGILQTNLHMDHMTVAWQWTNQWSNCMLHFDLLSKKVFANHQVQSD